MEPLAAANHPPPVSKVPSLPSGRAACRGREMSVHIIQIHAYVHAHDHEDLKPKTLCSEWCNVCRWPARWTQLGTSQPGGLIPSEMPTRQRKLAGWLLNQEGGEDICGDFRFHVPNRRRDDHIGAWVLKRGCMNLKGNRNSTNEKINNYLIPASCVVCEARDFASCTPFLAIFLRINQPTTNRDKINDFRFFQC